MPRIEVCGCCYRYRIVLCSFRQQENGRGGSSDGARRRGGLDVVDARRLMFKLTRIGPTRVVTFELHPPCMYVNQWISQSVSTSEGVLSKCHIVNSVIEVCIITALTP